MRPMKRLFDVISSLLVLVIFSPFFLLISALIVVDSPGGVLFRQKRIGKGGRQFNLYKFRSMYCDAEKKGQLTVGGRDSRITRVGYWLRKYKLDEYPQLINVLKADMSVVGPRPEVPKYTSLYNEEQKEVLSVSPGLTDYASLEYIDENRLLGKAEDPETTYIKQIMPDKLELNLRYLKKRSFTVDLKIIFSTIGKIYEKRH